MKIASLFAALLLVGCTMASSEGIKWEMPNMDDMKCYSSEVNPAVITCAKGDTLPQDPDLFNTVIEVTISFFPLVEPPENLRFVIIYQSVKEFEERVYERLPWLKERDESGENFYVHAHTYFDVDDFAIVIECPTPMNIQTMVHELLHHITPQVAEDGILDHLIVDRLANIIIESPRMKEALRENH